MKEIISTVVALYGDALSHQRTFVYGDGLKKEDVSVDLKDDLPQILERELQTRIKESRA